SPALLLDGRLGAAITDDPGFREWCEEGFRVACWAMEELASLGHLPYSRDAIVDFVRGNVFDLDDEGGGFMPRLAEHIGFALGGLSAIALVQLEGAKEGVQELMRLLERL